MSIGKFEFIEFFLLIVKNMCMKNLKDYRKKHGIMQKELASELGVAVSTFSGWESGAYEIDNKNLIKLAKILDVSVGFLLDVESEQQMFDDARVPKTEIQELFDALTPAQQQNLLNYARGMAVSNTLDNSSNSLNYKKNGIYRN